jgi:hypothetical protein
MGVEVGAAGAALADGAPGTALALTSGTPGTALALASAAVALGAAVGLAAGLPLDRAAVGIAGAAAPGPAPAATR